MWTASACRFMDIESSAPRQKISCSCRIRSLRTKRKVRLFLFFHIPSVINDCLWSCGADKNYFLTLPILFIVPSFSPILPGIAEKSCLQFGKQDDAGARFALDYRWPLSPVQAFGIFLTANNWVGPKEKKEK